jgi:hypothetical protein
MISTIRKELCTWSLVFLVDDGEPNEPRPVSIPQSFQLPQLELALVKNPMDISQAPSKTTYISLRNDSI